MNIPCPKCQASLNLPDDAEGKLVRCPACQGQRLNPQARAVRVGGRTIVEACAMPIDVLARWMEPAGELEKALSPVQTLVPFKPPLPARALLGMRAG